MHEALAKLYIARVERRVSERDCPSEPPLSTENMEDVILALTVALRWVVKAWIDPGPMGTMTEMQRAVSYAKSIIPERT